MSKIKITSSMSVKVKLAITICLIVILSVGITAFLNIRGSEQALSKQIEEQMETYAEATAEGIAKDVSAMRAKVEFIAMDARIQSGDVATIIARLSEIKQTQPDIETLFFGISKKA